MGGMGKSRIQYAEYAWSPVTGCRPGLPCAARCWAAAMHRRLHPDVDFWTPREHPEVLDRPLRTKRSGGVAVAFGGDLFAAGVSTGFMRRVFSAMDEAKHHTFLVLTKRPERMAWLRLALPMPNVLLGTSVSTQAEADERLPHLMALAAAGWRTWVSVEPMLGAVELREYLPGEETGYGSFHGGDPRDFLPDPECSTEKEREAHRLGCVAWGNGERPTVPVSDLEVSPEDVTLIDQRTGKVHEIPAGTPMFVERSAYGLGTYTYPTTGLSWVVCGGESGPGARPMQLDWARSLRDHCAESGVPFFYKQGPGDGAWFEHDADGGRTVLVVPGGKCGAGMQSAAQIGCKTIDLPVLDGRTHAERPGPVSAPLPPSMPGRQEPPRAPNP